jgi:hypothetical protein
MRVQRRERGRRRRVPRRPAVVGETLAAAESDPVRDLDDLVEADRAARALADGALAAA